ncbi:MAG: hypothetical protein J1F43_04590, partial [Muribaculaceae bacterium]|nr:hypothetical protein [Muribaculaceae bacterium]
SNISLILLCFLSWPKLSENSKKISIISILCIAVLSSYSLIIFNQPSRILRFSLIIFFVIFSYFIALPRDKCLKALTVTAISYSIFLIALEIFLIFFCNEVVANQIRNVYVIPNGLGDVYPKYGRFYAIQLLGTAAIPFVFMLSITYPIVKKRLRLCQLILLAGVVIAGNFAYLLAIGFYFIIRFIDQKATLNKWRNRFLFVLFIIIFSFPYIYTFISNTLEEKKEESNAIRMDQAEVLISDLSNSIPEFIFGKGLGHTINVKTKWRDYTDNDYFELQALYFFNQLGFIPFFIFVLFNIYLTFRYIKDKKAKELYLAYLLYSVTNPYIFSTNQVVVIITLVSISYREYCKYNPKSKNESICCHSIV